MNPEQEDEIYALKGIYDELLQEFEGEPTRYSLSLPITLPEPYSITRSGVTTDIQYLPNVKLYWNYFKFYPESEYLEIEIESSWITNEQKQDLLKYWKSLWIQHKSVMIFQIADFVTNDMIPFLKQSHQNVSKVDVKSFEFQLAGQNQAVYNEILEFNQSKLKLIFNQSHFHCDVCKNTKLGSESIQFQNCKHTYCISCVKEYFEYLIVQGNVELVCCPHEVCKQNAKENHISTGLHHLTFHDLQIVLKEDILTRYYELYHQKALQSRSGVVHCPRPMCQYPSIKSDNDSDTLIVCVTCNFPFCSNCLSLWHGTNSCQLENEEEPLDDICNAEKLRDCNCSKASKGYSQETHNRYHKRKQLDKKNIEESLRWIKEKSVQCPGCSLYIRRTVGCPSMYCHCGCHFCYNCGQTYESYSGPHNCRFLPHVTSRDELDTLDNNTMW